MLRSPCSAHPAVLAALFCLTIIVQSADAKDPKGNDLKVVRGAFGRQVLLTGELVAEASGIYPAVRVADLDPIDALRWE